MLKFEPTIKSFSHHGIYNLFNIHFVDLSFKNYSKAMQVSKNFCALV